MKTTLQPVTELDITIPLELLELKGDLVVPESANGLVLFAHGSGSSRKSSRNRFVAEILHENGIGTLLFDLLTISEEKQDVLTAEFRFNINLLSERLIRVTNWMIQQFGAVQLGYFGASTGAAAALNAAAFFGERIGAVVSRGGRPDLAGSNLRKVQSPTLLIVGGRDNQVIQLNEQAFAELVCVRKLELVPGATHLFEEPGTLQQAAKLASAWFKTSLASISE